MFTLKNDQLELAFPELHEDARLVIEFQRTLRIPDDNRAYPLPPGLGQFPMRHVDDYAAKVPSKWREHGGVFLPMYQAEALWISFRSARRLSVRGQDCRRQGECCFRNIVDQRPRLR